MSRTRSRSSYRLPLILLALLGYAVPLAAQLEKPPPGATTPTIVKAVASLTADGSKGAITLDWPAAQGASEYRVTRVDNKGSQEATIYQGPAQNFVFEGKECVVTTAANAFKNCIYQDTKVAKGTLYSYRVWTGGGPSPVASARSK
jgi:hypothetical protein